MFGFLSPFFVWVLLRASLETDVFLFVYESKNPNYKHAHTPAIHTLFYICTRHVMAGLLEAGIWSMQLAICLAPYTSPPFFHLFNSVVESAGELAAV